MRCSSVAGAVAISLLHPAPVSAALRQSIRSRHEVHDQTPNKAESAHVIHAFTRTGNLELKSVTLSGHREGGPGGPSARIGAAPVML
ncbi:hypothetical protein B0J15DRAFT_64395 [Fusarium solani]|uniref:Uncharacterized protein n=1 Tax=Fusarium solani TaxID=169388 RepID=A0A9P9H044_FUSSL|nr:uncharacterized protein B0J15DRAFT_64395 [Fusarium solani]KAH7247794.1 hypothetical protein B0J15DRAFT_64395 [Fusarium solani]